MSIIINARSPYIIEIDETGQIETKIQLFLWNAGSSTPSSPTYTMSKKIPATNNPAAYYDIAPFIQEYIKNYIAPNVATISSTDANEWCNVKVKKFKKISTSFIQVGTDLSFYAVNGYGEYTEGSNPNSGRFLMIDYDEINYNASTPTNTITILANSGDYIEYVDLISGSIETEIISSNGFKDIRLVHPSWVTSGNYFQYKNNAGTLLYEQKMVPRDWCKYTPIKCDFVNKLGGWETTWFYARSNDSISKTASKYNFLMDESLGYDYKWGTQKTFNTNGVKSIKVNTDWVEEEYKLIIEQILMSERVLLYEKFPVNITTQSVELYKSIDTKMINYELNFDFAYNFINNVI